jgi:hypothetical protein
VNLVEAGSGHCPGYLTRKKTTKNSSLESLNLNNQFTKTYYEGITHDAVIYRTVG